MSIDIQKVCHPDYECRCADSGECCCIFVGDECRNCRAPWVKIDFDSGLVVGDENDCD